MNTATDLNPLPNSYSERPNQADGMPRTVVCSNLPPRPFGRWVSR